MGLRYIYLDKVDEAIHTFQHTLAMTEKLTMPGQLLSLYWNTCRYFAETNNYYNATLYTHKFLQRSYQENRNAFRSEIYHYLGRVMIRGDQQKTLADLEHLLQDSSVKQDNLTLASVTTTIADLFLRQGKVERANEHAQKAYELVSSYADGIISAYTLIVLGRIAYAQKDYKEGDTHFVAGLGMLERLDMREDLANQSAYYAQLLESRGMVKEALEFYKKAFESRQSG